MKKETTFKCLKIRLVKFKMDKVLKNKNGHGQNNGHTIKSPLPNGKSKAIGAIGDSNGNTGKVLEQNRDKTATSGTDNPKQDRKPGQINLEGVPIDRGWAWAVLTGTNVGA